MPDRRHSWTSSSPPGFLALGDVRDRAARVPLRPLMHRHSSTVGQLLERTAARVPGRTALRFGERAWTYAELDAAVGRVAARLLAEGFAKGDRIAAYGRNSDAYVILFLACARAGLVHVPINYNAIAGELEYLLTQSSASIVL